MFFKPLSFNELDMDRPLFAFKQRSRHSADHLSLRDLFENVLITGSTGSGKTSTIGYYLAQSLLDKSNVPDQHKIGLFVFLYKASDYAVWEKWCQANNREEDIIVIDNSYQYVFNLLAHYKNQEAINAVNVLMYLSNLSLNGMSQGNSEPYWEQAKRQRLHRLILLNQLSGEPLNMATLYHIHSTAPQHRIHLEDKTFLRQSVCIQMLEKAAKRVGEEDARFKLVSQYFMKEIPYMSHRTSSSIFSLTSAILEPFVSSPLLYNLFCGETTMDMKQLLKGKIVLFNLPIQRFEYSGKVAQILFKHMICKHIESRDLIECPNPVVLWLDEYQHYITEYDYFFLSTARGARAGCVLMTQNISNLYAQIGGNGRAAEERVNSLLSLTNHKIFLSQNGFTTNEFASKTIGQEIKLLRSHTAQLSQSSGSASLSEHYHYQVMPKHFSELKRGGHVHKGEVEAIITATGKQFSNQRNYLRASFIQPWYRTKNKKIF